MPSWKLKGKRYDEIREEVANLIEDYGIARYPFNLHGLIHQIRIRLIPYSVLPESLRLEVEAAWPNAVTLRPDNFDAARTIIFYNDAHSFKRVRFTLAHELGHIILEHPAVKNELYEIEADIFANYLLGPTPLVLRDSVNSIDNIMVDFNVSYACANSIRNCAERRRLFGSKALLDYERRILEASCLVKGGVQIALP